MYELNVHGDGMGWVCMPVACRVFFVSNDVPHYCCHPGIDRPLDCFTGGHHFCTGYSMIFRYLEGVTQPGLLNPGVLLQKCNLGKTTCPIGAS